MKKSIGGVVAVVAISSVLFSGCETAGGHEGAVIGGAAGAAGGALIGSAAAGSHNRGTGALIGGVLGGAAGAVAGDQLHDKKQAPQQCNEAAGAMAETQPLHFHDETFCVRAYESGVNNRVTLPSYCNYLQEVAGNHARALGLGIRELQSAGFTWMLSRLHLVITSYAAWRELVNIRTWPSGMRGRLTATRDFRVRGDSGETLLLGVSEWLYVELGTLKIVRLPPAFAALAPEGTPQVDVPEAAGKIPDFAAAEWSATLTVRHSDHDFNNHVNNAHYVEWALECLPDGWNAARRVCELDIAYRAAATWGDTVISEAMREKDGVLLHRIRRASDQTVLATARTVWRANEGI